MDAQIDYGQDAPGLMRGFLGAAIAAWVLGVVCAFFGAGFWAILGIVVFGMAGLYLSFMGCFMIYESKVGKVRDRERILDLVSWRGQEHVLDLGCGRGLMLIGAVRRAPEARGIGIDLWRQEDQAQNSAEATLKNAEKAGVADRVGVQTADMLDLPFADDHFDVILSSWAIHNLPTLAAREKALAEAMRVLRPGGIMALTDIQGRDHYPPILRALGGVQVTLHVLHPMKDRLMSFLSFGSFAPFTVTAQKAD